MGADKIRISGESKSHLALARVLGADRTINIKEGSLREQIRAGAYDPHLAIIAAPTVDDAITALHLMRSGGDLLLFSGYHADTQISFNLDKFHYAEKHIHSSIDCTITDFQQGMRLQRRLQMTGLITNHFPLTKTPQAFQMALDPHRINIILTP